MGTTLKSLTRPKTCSLAQLLGLAMMIAGAAGCSNSVSDAIEQLHESDSDARYAAAKELEDLGPKAEPAVPALAEALKDSDHKVRYRAAKALSKVAGDLKPAVPALAAALDDPQRDVRYYAAKALDDADEDAATVVSKLVAALEKEHDAKVRYYLVKALKNVASEADAAVPVLERTLRDPDEQVRRMAASALEKIRK